MLGKQYSLGATFENTGEQRVKIANFDELKQQGQDIAGFVGSFTPDSAYMYLHVIAMGAGEYYGCNINGDYFPEADLINRHKTFEINAKVFKEHDNKPTSPSYGHVVFAWYNKKMHRVELILAVDKIKGKEFVDRQERGEQLEVSMGCFPKGTLVTTTNGAIPIENITPGEKVLTHKGNIKKAITKFCYPYTGDMVTLKIGGQTRTLTATGNHPILVRRYTTPPQSGEGVCLVCGKRVKQVATHLYRNKSPEHLAYVKSIKDRNVYTESWIDARDIQIGDYLLQPIKINSKNISVDENIAKLTGYFLAEGSYVKYKERYVAIQLNFASYENMYHNDVLSCLQKVSSVKPTIQIRENKHVGVISIYDKKLSTIILNLCGEYSHYKHINNDIHEWDTHSKLLLIGAYINGDGTFNPITKQISITTVSKQLALDVIAILSECGISSSIYETQGHKSKIYYVSISKNDTYKLEEYTYKVPKGYTYNRTIIKNPVVFVDGNYLLKAVTAKDIYNVQNEDVYNLSVEDDESYVTESVAVHNCKVAYDVCSICGNKAKKSSDYCDHIRHHKKEIYPDGKQPYMINYNPTFFDISIVRRRADRIAYVLSKVASVNESMGLGDYAENFFDTLGSDIPYTEDPVTYDIEEEFSKVASTQPYKYASAAEKLAMIKHIKAQAVKTVNEDIAKAMPAIEAAEPDLPIPLLDRMANNYSFEDILKSLFTRAIPLKPMEATRIIIVQHGLPITMAPNIMHSLLSTPPQKMELPGDYRREIGSLVDPFVMERSSFLPAILHRLKNKDTLEKKAAALAIDRSQAFYNNIPGINMGTIVYQNPMTSMESQNLNYGPNGIKIMNDYYAPNSASPALPTSYIQKLLAMLGIIYSGYRYDGNIASMVTDPRVESALRAKAMEAQQAYDSKTNLEKHASIPFVATHFISDNYGDYEKTASIVSSTLNDYIKDTAPIAASYALYKTAGIIDPDIVRYPVYVDKIASLNDALVDFTTGAVVKERTQNPFSSGATAMVEAPVISNLTEGIDSLIYSHGIPLFYKARSAI